VKLVFIRQSNANTSKEEEINALIMKIWNELEGEKRGGILPDTLRTFTAAIMQIILNPDIKPQPNGYGTFQESGVFTVNTTQAVKIHKDFNLFYLNKKSYGGAITTGKQQEEAECSFKPEICEKSVVLASNAREKLTGSVLEDSKDLSHIELLTRMGRDQEAYFCDKH
jgi:hypothetical protein